MIFYCILIGLSKYKYRHDVEVVMKVFHLMCRNGITKPRYTFLMHHVAEGKTEGKQVIELVSAFNICKHKRP